MADREDANLSSLRDSYMARRLASFARRHSLTLDDELVDALARDAELRSALHAVRARAEMHGGTVMTRNPVGRRETEVRLPLLTAAPS